MLQPEQPTAQPVDFFGLSGQPEKRFDTPEDRHTGREAAILAQREVVYARARQQHPERWSGATRNWTPVTTARLNPTKDDLLDQERRAA